MRTHLGGGTVYTLGAWLDDALQDALIGWIVAQAGVEPVLPNLPPGVHAMKRGNAYILVNNSEAKTVSLPWRARNHLSGKTAKRLEPAPWGVAVMTKK